MSAGALPFAGLHVPARLFPHRVDVERSTATGKDTSGGAVEGWVTAYTQLPCSVQQATAEDLREFAQKGIRATGVAWFPPQGPTKVLPLLGVRDRMKFGVYPGTTRVRYLRVEWVQDELELGLVLRVAYSEWRPG